MRIRLMETPLALPRYRQVRLPTVAAELAPYAQVEINDENVQPLDLSPVDLVGFTAQPYNVGRAIHLSQKLRARGVPTILGGPHATTMGVRMLEHFDAVVVGEVEGLGQRICRDLERGSLAGVYQNERPPDLARLRLPRRDLQPARPYYSLNFPIELTRGCPHRCSFCYGPYGFPSFRTRPLDQIAADLDQWDQGYVEAVDMHFAADRQHILEVCRLLEERRVWGWMGEATLRSMDDPELLDRMARSHCKAVFVGLESIEEDALRGVRKGFNRVREYRRIIRMIQDHGIFVHTGLIFGLDGATRQGFEATARFCEELGIFLASPNFFTLFPGTREHQQAQEQGRVIAQELRDYDGVRLTIEPRGLSRQETYEGARRFVERFYSYGSIFRRSIQPGCYDLSQLWGFWGVNLAYRSWFKKWARQLGQRRQPWGREVTAEQGFPWVGDVPWYYPISEAFARLATRGHHAWDRLPKTTSAPLLVALLAVLALVSPLALAGIRLLASRHWPVPWPPVAPGLGLVAAAGSGGALAVERLARLHLRGFSQAAGLAASLLPMCCALLALPEHARGWRFFCALCLLTLALKSWDLLRCPGKERDSSLRLLSFLLLWPTLDYREAFKREPSRALLVRHYAMMGLGLMRLAVAGLLFPALFYMGLQGQDGGWLLLGVLGRLLLAYLLLRGFLEYLTAYWRMVGCIVPAPFGRQPFGPSPSAIWRSWHRSLHSWLKRHVYLPLGGRQRPGMAVLGCFLVSGSLAALSLAPVAGRMPWEVALFFLAQGGLVALEKRLQRQGAPAGLRRLVPVALLALLLGLAPWLFAVTDRILV